MMLRRNIQTTPVNGVVSNGEKMASPPTEERILPKKETGSVSLVSRCCLPHYLDDNVYLIDSHRPEISSIGGCLKTIFSFHTETLNIWTHLVGCFGCSILAPYVLLTSQSELVVRLFLALYFLGAIVCLGASTTFHAFACHSEEVNRFLVKLDYCGIILLIVTSFPPWLYFSFYCHWNLKCAYIVLVSVLGLASIVVVLQDRFRKAEYYQLRAALFISLGLTGFLPGLHYLLFLRVIESSVHVFWLFTMAGLYLVGGTIYALRVPERLLPGKCDIWFQSHQLMHLCVIGGIISCYLGIGQFMNDIRDIKCSD